MSTVQARDIMTRTVVTASPDMPGERDRAPAARTPFQRAADRRCRRRAGGPMSSARATSRPQPARTRGAARLVAGAAGGRRGAQSRFHRQPARAGPPRARHHVEPGHCRRRRADPATIARLLLQYGSSACRWCMRAAGVVSPRQPAADRGGNGGRKATPEREAGVRTGPRPWAVHRHARRHRPGFPVEKRPRPRSRRARVRWRRPRAPVADFAAWSATSKTTARESAAGREAAERRSERVKELASEHIETTLAKSVAARPRSGGARRSSCCCASQRPVRDGGRKSTRRAGPETLRGEAAEITLRWERDLKPRGFHLPPGCSISRRRGISGCFGLGGLGPAAGVRRPGSRRARPEDAG